MQFHHKKSEIQVGKESKGVSSDYSRNPYNIISSGQSHHYHHHNHNHHNQQQKQQQNSGTLLLQDEAFTTAHKRPLLQHPSAGAPAAKTSPKTYESSGLCKNKNPSSGLVRSPTIKTSIQSFDAATAAAILQHHHHHHHHHHGRWWFHAHMTRRLRVRRNLLAPAVVVIAVPCFWWYFRALGQDSYEEEDVDAGLVGLWFDFFAAIVFFTGVVVCVRIAFPGFAGLLVSASLAALRDRRTRASKIVKVANVLRSPVTWTIGSKAKVEQSPKFSSQEGVRVFGNGDVYEGEFHKGKSSGSGVYYYCVSGRYEGDWVDGKYDGYGIETWAKGSRYRGQYRQGLRHGYGVYRFYTGDVYSGEWCNGQSHGYGVHTCEDGSRYVGEFKWGVKHGLGYYHFRNGDTYAGEYFADRMHGFGVYLFANGHVYEGAWHEGTKQGLGMYTFRNGESHCGHWNRGVLETPTTHNSQPGSPIAVNHSKVLNAVQEARHAAEKAYKIPRVDEKVNRAVAAANKSANAARIAAVKAVQKKMHGNLLHANV